MVLFDNWRSLLPLAAAPMAAFLLLCNGFGSFAGRFVALPIFLVTVVTLFRREGARPGA